MDLNMHHVQSAAVLQARAASCVMLVPQRTYLQHMGTLQPAAHAVQLATNPPATA